MDSAERLSEELSFFSELLCSGLIWTGNIHLNSIYLIYNSLCYASEFPWFVFLESCSTITNICDNRESFWYPSLFSCKFERIPSSLGSCIIESITIDTITSESVWIWKRKMSLFWISRLCILCYPSYSYETYLHTAFTKELPWYSRNILEHTSRDTNRILYL